VDPAIVDKWLDHHKCPFPTCICGVRCRFRKLRDEGGARHTFSCGNGDACLFYCKPSKPLLCLNFTNLLHQLLLKTSYVSRIVGFYCAPMNVSVPLPSYMSVSLTTRAFPAKAKRSGAAPDTHLTPCPFLPAGDFRTPTPESGGSESFFSSPSTTGLGDWDETCEDMNRISFQSAHNFL
jgi:hypothetical protein